MYDNSERIFLILLQKMLREADDILAFKKGMSFFEFKEDLRTRKAIIMSLVNIGEYASAARKKCADCVAKYPQIPFDEMAALRNVAAHEYDKPDIESVYATADQNIPALESVLKQAICELSTE